MGDFLGPSCDLFRDHRCVSRTRYWRQLSRSEHLLTRESDGKSVINLHPPTEATPAVVASKKQRNGSTTQQVQAGAVLLVVVGTAVAVTLRDPHEPGSFGICPSLLLIGIHCPGCGTLRGMAALTSGDIAGTMGHNLLLIPMLVALVAWALLQWFPKVEAKFRVQASRFRPTWVNVPVIVGVVFLIFTVLRNLPGSGLAP